MMYLYILISAYTSLISSQAQFTSLDVAGQTRTPFILNSGAIYRDMKTIEASKLVAKFAKKHNTEFTSKFHSSNLIVNLRPPKFIQFKNFTFGQPQPDNDIFDFTDSRFLNPPLENQQNRPILDKLKNPETFPVEISTNPIQGKVIVNPIISQYLQSGSYPNENIHKTFTFNQNHEVLNVNEPGTVINGNPIVYENFTEKSSENSHNFVETTHISQTPITPNSNSGNSRTFFTSEEFNLVASPKPFTQLGSFPSSNPLQHHQGTFTHLTTSPQHNKITKHASDQRTSHFPSSNQNSFILPISSVVKPFDILVLDPSLNNNNNKNTIITKSSPEIFYVFDPHQQSTFHKQIPIKQELPGSPSSIHFIWT